MSSETTDETVSTSAAQSTSQDSTASTVTNGMNSLSLKEINSTEIGVIPKYTTWIRVLEDVDDDWDQSVAQEVVIPKLKLRAGDILKVEDRLNRTDLWVGSNGDDIGLFPIDSRLAPVVYSKVISLYEHTNDLDRDDIPFQAGQIMDVVTVPSNWWIWASYDWTSPTGETKRFSGTVPFNLTEPIPPEGMKDNPKPEPDLGTMEKYPNWEDVPEFSVRALWNYKAQSEREIDLVSNEVIVVTKVWGDTWYYGSKNGRSGSFSSGYVSKDLSRPASTSIRPPYHRYYVRAQYDYNSTGRNQMNLVANEIIEVIWINSDGWWEGRSRDRKRRGLFPSNYVRKMADDRVIMQYQP
ncbi:Intersectin-2 [Serendipita sp. 411]|nr:Intersectin-2 [Serendipita sp. 397]KAG8846932.1 Intersectin-2 [Serendipita sp. 411]